MDPPKPFPILRLPFLAIEEVFKAMHPFEIINFSLISNRTKQITKSMNFYPEYSVALDINKILKIAIRGTDNIVSGIYEMTSKKNLDGVIGYVVGGFKLTVFKYSKDPIEGCKKEMRKLYLQGVKDKLQNLLEQTHHSSSTTTFIPPAKLILSSEIDNHDKTVINMKREIEEKYVLNEADPIIVLENNGQFEVVSGTKRALAYKSMQVESICVSAISSAEKERVVLSKFLTSSRLTDQDTLKTIPIIFQLFEFLDVTPSSLTTWTNKEISMVFSEFLGKTTKLKFLFDICTLSDLCQSIKKLCESGINCSVHLCRDSLRKFRQNPQDVLTILATPLASEIEIRKMLSHVEPDVMFLMEQKKVDLTTASHLNQIYGHDPRFSSFIRGADFRCVNKKDQKAYIESRFELFKQKNNTEFSSLPKTTFEVATEHSNFDMVITYSEALSESILKKTRNVTVVLIGHSISSGSNYAMFLPDCLSSKSITGKLQNLLMLTFRIKQNDIHLKDEEISSELRASGLIDKTLLSISDLIIFFKPRSNIFIDLVYIKLN